jgi:hypothetical protein
MRPKKIVIREPMEVYKIVGRVNRDGLEKTAQALGTHKSTLSRWLDTQGYVMVRTWEDAKVLEMKKGVRK